MKKNLLLFLNAMICFGLFSQTLPDIIPEEPSTSHHYYENKGQIKDFSDSIRNDIKFYTERTQPMVYLANSMASYVFTATDTTCNDTLCDIYYYRFDMEFVNSEDECLITPEEQGRDSLNYYLPHCGDGIEGVRGYKRIVYENVYPYIDYHFYSNSNGLKSYIVVHPGGNPSDILLKFSGQDSVGIIDSTILALYSGFGGVFMFPQTTAYQINAFNIPIGGTWNPEWESLGSGLVTLQIDSFDTTKTLVIRIADIITPRSIKRSVIPGLNWSTYYGGSATEEMRGVYMDIPGAHVSKSIFVTGVTTSSDFPISSGAAQLYLNGFQDAYVAKFNEFSVRNWASYYGGSGEDEASGISSSQFLPSVFVVGSTNSTNLPMPVSNNGLFKQTTYGGGMYDAFVLALNKIDGTLYWTTYFGGNARDVGQAITVNYKSGSGYHVFIAGYTEATLFTSNSTPALGYFPIANKLGAYSQNFNNGWRDGFIAEFNDARDLEWSSLFGGEIDDYIEDITTSSEYQDIAIVGRTDNTAVPSTPSSPYLAIHDGKFPIANPGGSSYVQTYNTNQTGFVAKFNASRSLIWSTFFGGDGVDNATSVATNSHNDIYIVGSTTTSLSQSGCSPLINGKFPICNSNGGSFIQSAYGGNKDLFIARFTDGGELKWSTYYGSDGFEDSKGYIYGGHNIGIDEHDNVFIAFAGGSYYSTKPLNPLASYFNSMLYNQSSNASINEPKYFSDVFLASFTNTNQQQWATYFGGGCQCQTFNASDPVPDEIMGGLAVGDNTLVLVGKTWGLFTPTEEPSTVSFPPYIDKNINGTNDGFITRFDIPNGSVNTSINSVSNNSNPLTLYPNPVNDELHIIVPSGFNNNYFNVSIFDVNGKILSTIDFDNQDDFNDYIIKTESLQTGMYLVKISNDQSVFYGKFVK